MYVVDFEILFKDKEGCIKHLSSQILQINIK
jgi:hypothetical protein